VRRSYTDTSRCVTLQILLTPSLASHKVSYANRAALVKLICEEIDMLKTKVRSDHHRQDEARESGDGAPEEGLRRRKEDSSVSEFRRSCHQRSAGSVRRR
jgi:hypothetical protein